MKRRPRTGDRSSGGKKPRIRRKCQKAANGLIGVRLEKTGRRWSARIRLPRPGPAGSNQGKQVTLGSYGTEYDAAFAYDVAARRYGRPLNFLDDVCGSSGGHPEVAPGRRAEIKSNVLTLLFGWEDTLGIVVTEKKTGGCDDVESSGNFEEELQQLGQPRDDLEGGNWPTPAPGRGDHMEAAASFSKDLPEASEYYGVSYRNSGERHWVAHIDQSFLGQFHDERQAARAYDAVASRHGRRLNFPEDAPRRLRHARDVGCGGGNLEGVCEKKRRWGGLSFADEAAVISMVESKHRRTGLHDGRSCGVGVDYGIGGGEGGNSADSCGDGAAVGGSGGGGFDGRGGGLSCGGGRRAAGLDDTSEPEKGEKRFGKFPGGQFNLQEWISSEECTLVDGFEFTSFGLGSSHVSDSASAGPVGAGAEGIASGVTAADSQNLSRNVASARLDAEAEVVDDFKVTAFSTETFATAAEAARLASMEAEVAALVASEASHPNLVVIERTGKKQKRWPLRGVKDLCDMTKNPLFISTPSRHTAGTSGASGQTSRRPPSSSLDAEVDGSLVWFRYARSWWWPSILFSSWHAVEAWGLPLPPSKKNKAKPRSKGKLPKGVTAIAVFCGPSMSFGLIKGSLDDRSKVRPMRLGSAIDSVLAADEVDGDDGGGGGGGSGDGGRRGREIAENDKIDIFQSSVVENQEGSLNYNWAPRNAGMKGRLWETFKIGVEEACEYLEVERDSSSEESEGEDGQDAKGCDKGLEDEGSTNEDCASGKRKNRKHPRPADLRSTRQDWTLDIFHPSMLCSMPRPHLQWLAGQIQHPARDLSNEELRATLAKWHRNKHGNGKRPRALLR